MDNRVIDRDVLSIISASPKHTKEVYEESSLSMSSIQIAIERLKARQLIRRDANGKWERIRL